VWHVTALLKWMELPRLHANLLFYGLDGGTWSDPPSSPPGRGAHDCRGGGEQLGGDAGSRDPRNSGQEPQPKSRQRGLGHEAIGLDTIKAVWSGSSAKEAEVEGASGVGAAAVNTAAYGGGLGGERLSGDARSWVPPTNGQEPWLGSWKHAPGMDAAGLDTTKAAWASSSFGEAIETQGTGSAVVLASGVGAVNTAAFGGGSGGEWLGGEAGAWELQTSLQGPGHGAMRFDTFNAVWNGSATGEAADHESPHNTGMLVGGDWLCAEAMPWDLQTSSGHEPWPGHHPQDFGQHGAVGLDTLKAVWSNSAAADAAEIEGANSAGVLASGVGPAAVNTAAVGGGCGAVFATEPSTDEGSEHKGSESDSLPDSSEGHLAPGMGPPPQQAQFSAAPQTAVFSYLPPPATLCGATQTGHVAPPPLTTPPLATPVESAAPATSFNQYMQQGGFLTHATPTGCGAGGFGANGESESYAYDAAGAPPFPTIASTASATTAPAGAPSFPPIASGAAAAVAPESPSSTGAVGPENVPSIGSYAHLSGQCSRCCFHPKGRCANGFSCQFCHFDHDKRPRNGKKKRYRRQADGTIVEGAEE